MFINILIYKVHNIINYLPLSVESKKKAAVYQIFCQRCMVKAFEAVSGTQALWALPLLCFLVCFSWIAQSHRSFCVDGKVLYRGCSVWLLLVVEEQWALDHETGCLIFDRNQFACKGKLTPVTIGSHIGWHSSRSLKRVLFFSLWIVHAQ